MTRVLLIILSMSLMSILSGCDADSNGADVKATAHTGAVNEQHTTASAGTQFGDEITRQPCDLLTPNAVAAVAGVDPSALVQRNMTSTCMYTWQGGQASVGRLDTYASIEYARGTFEDTYRNQSGEEVAQGMAKINTQLQKQKDEGKTEVDPEHAKVVTGALSGAFSGGFQYEDIPGLGDLARFEVTRIENKFGGKTFVSYANSLNVLTGNLKFNVAFNREGEAKLYREENVALAEAVLKQLPH